MGRPMDCCSWSRAKVKMRVSELIDFLFERSALDQILCWRKMGRGEESDEASSPSKRMCRERSSSEPMW